MARARSTYSRALVVLVAAGTLLWLAFVLYLDIHYGKFPDVLVGGVKILAVFYLAGLIMVGMVVLVRKSWNHCRRLMSKRARGGEVRDLN